MVGDSEATGVRITDGTGRIAIVCPAAVTALGPVMHREFEFDVSVPPGPRHTPPGEVVRVTASAVRPLNAG
jgi:hypothetical protein